MARNLYRKKISRMPIERLWDERGAFGERNRNLDRRELDDLMQQKPAVIAVAALGSTMRWHEGAEAWHFWTSVRDNVVTDFSDDGFSVSDYPDDWAYVPSLWFGRTDNLIVLLEEHH